MLQQNLSRGTEQRLGQRCSTQEKLIVRMRRVFHKCVGIVARGQRVDLKPSQVRFQTLFLCTKRQLKSSKYLYFGEVEIVYLPSIH